jgi:hypothetical protein
MEALPHRMCGTAGASEGPIRLSTDSVQEPNVVPQRNLATRELANMNLAPSGRRRDVFTNAEDPQRSPLLSFDRLPGAAPNCFR